jgi:hypothetical protein
MLLESSISPEIGFQCGKSGTLVADLVAHTQGQ